MSATREFSHITLSTTPYKKRLDEETHKNELETNKDEMIAFKCADRFNYNTNFHKRVTLSDRFELTALGYEMKGKPSTPLSTPTLENYIYRKEKKQDVLAGSPLPAGMSPQNPLPAGRGFLTPPAAPNNAFVYPGARRGSASTPKPPSAIIRPPNRSVFEDIPANFV